MPDGDPPRNLFVRFKHHVDSNISAGFNSLFSSSRPSSTSSTSSSHSRAADPRLSQASGGGGDTTLEMGTNGSAFTSDVPVCPVQTQPSVDAVVTAQIDRLRGGDRGAASQAWHMFLRASPYSPLVLQDQANMTGSWSPRPRDLDPMERAAGPPYAAGWLDAFEDLLRAQSALPMLEPAELWRPYPVPTSKPNSWASPLMGGCHRPKKGFSCHARYPGNFLRTLRLHAVDEVWIPISEPGYRSPATLDDWAARRHQEAQDRAANCHLAGGPQFSTYAEPPVVQTIADHVRAQVEKARQQLEAMARDAHQQLESGVLRILDSAADLASDQTEVTERLSGMKQTFETLARDAQQDLDAVAEKIFGRQGANADQAQGPKLPSLFSMISALQSSEEKGENTLQDAFEETLRLRAAIEERVQAASTNGSSISNNKKEPDTEDELYALVRRMQAAEQELGNAMRSIIGLPLLDGEPQQAKSKLSGRPVPVAMPSRATTTFFASTPSSTGVDERAETMEDGGRVNKVVEKKVWVDSWGNEHSRLVTTWQHADGSENKEMQYSVRKSADGDAAGNAVAETTTHASSSSSSSSSSSIVRSWGGSWGGSWEGQNSWGSKGVDAQPQTNNRNMTWSKGDDGKGPQPEDWSKEQPKKGGWFWN